jgi:hypothetical protein
MILGLMGIAGLGICGESEEVNQEIIAQEKLTQTVVSRAAFLNKVVIGVLDFEESGPKTGRIEQIKRVVMRELNKNTRVKIINIRESCGLSDLKRKGYKQAEGYKEKYGLDMILHTHMDHPRRRDFHFSFNLIDLYTKKRRKVYSETKTEPLGTWVLGISSKILVDEDLDRVLKAKKAGLPK